MHQMSHNPIKVVDHSVSKETFELRFDEQYTMWRTHPKPVKDHLGAYYDSEDYISHTDGKRSLFEKVYHLVKGIMLSRKHKLVKTYASKTETLLDIGAGTGDFLKYCKQKSWKVTGIEPNKAARQRANEKELDIVESLAQLTGKYDVITLWHVLEHVYDLDEYISWLKEHLSENGLIIIAVPNYESYDAQYYKSFWAAYDVPRHLYHFSRQAIQKLFKEKSLDVIATHHLPFDAYYVSLLSEKYKHGKSKIWNAFRRGWISNYRARKSGAYSSLVYIIKHQKK